jgi:hypothetical protein
MANRCRLLPETCGCKTVDVIPLCTLADCTQITDDSQTDPLPPDFLLANRTVGRVL